MDPLLLTCLIVAVVLAIGLLIVAVFLLMRSRNSADDKQSSPVVDKQMRRGFRSSLSVLRAKIPDGDFLYRVPWVLALGEAGTGRTSLLRQLDTESSGTDTDVEWFFLQHGALIDVPSGFLLSQDGTTATDGRWRRLLRLLARNRSHRPIDGIVLAVAAPSLLASSAIADAQRDLRATAIRNQLDQLQGELRMVVPVYVLVTKCDYVRGFRDFCEQLDSKMSDQLFGWSNTSTLETSYSADRVDEAFNMLGSRLLEVQLGMFAREVFSSVDDLFLFPAELERMRAPMKEYLQQIFQETSYVEPNFFRGIYFCGDAHLQTGRASRLPVLTRGGSEMAQLHAPAELEPMVPDAQALAVLNLYQPQIQFVRHLFDLKVFPESKIAKATRGIRLSRNRGLVAVQIALAAFIIVFTVGTMMAYTRLDHFSRHRLKPTLDMLASRFPQSTTEQRSFSVTSAYDLVDLLGVADVHGFRALFLPASWSDPINATVGRTLAGAFSRRVLVAFKNELSQRVAKEKGSCGPVPALAQKLPTDVDALAQLNFENDLEYEGLEQSLSQMDRLRSAVATYNNLRLAGRGSFQDLNHLFSYLINRTLDDEGRFKHNSYYLRALAEQSGEAVEMKDYLDHRKDFESCMRGQTESRINNFFASWFGTNNPLPPLANGVADEIDELTSGAGHTREKLRFMVDDVRRLDALVSSGTYRWLREPAFKASTFPVLAKGVSAEPFADASFVERMNDNGNRAFLKLKDDLFSVRTGPTGYVLADFQGEIKVDPEVITAASNMDVLLTQDFMAEPSSKRQVVATGAMIWRKDGLARANQLVESYEKYLKDNLPLTPPGLRPIVRDIAHEGLRSTVLAAVANAQEPLNAGSTPDATTLMTEIRSFDEALPLLTQIGTSIGSGSSAASADLDRIVLQQGTMLGQQLSALFKSEAFFAPSQATLAQWNGVRSLSLLRYGAETPEDLEVYLSKQRQVLKAFSIDYALPLEQFLQSRRMQEVNGPDVWTGVIRDVRDYEANKPGNSLAALEAFIRSGEDKINLENACQPVVTGTPSASYFLAVRARLQKAAVDRCGEILMERYNKAAVFYNHHLAGKFPFDSGSTAGSGPEADEEATLAFLRDIDQAGAPLIKYLQSTNRNAEILTFLKEADAVRQLFTSAAGVAALSVDTRVNFRVNRAAEQSGDHIIEWKIQFGDGQATMGSPQNGLRWIAGMPVRVTLRLAKDSPDVPVAGSGMRVEGRSVTFEFGEQWALFRMLSAQGGGSSEFGVEGEGSRGMLRFVIPTAADPVGKASGTLKANDEIRVFARLTFLAAGSKEPHEVAIPNFPEFAPLSSPMKGGALTN